MFFASTAPFTVSAPPAPRYNPPAAFHVAPAATVAAWQICNLPSVPVYEDGTDWPIATVLEAKSNDPVQPETSLRSMFSVLAVPEVLNVPLLATEPIASA